MYGLGGMPAAVDVQVGRGSTMAWDRDTQRTRPRDDDVLLKIDDIVAGVVDTTTRQTPTARRGSSADAAD